MRVVLAIAASQRVLLSVILLILAIGVSARISHSLVVDSAQRVSLSAPPAALVAHIVGTQQLQPLTSLHRPEAIMLLDAYKKELARHDTNRVVLGNLILLASSLGLDKEVALYQRQLYLSDPLSACSFSLDSASLLNITCPTPLL